MDFSTVATLAGYKSHYTADMKRTLCGREVSNGTDGTDMCKACTNKVAKLTEAETVASTHAEIIASLPQIKAEMQALGNDVPSMGAAPVEPTYTPGQPVSVYATVTGETEEFEAAHIPNGNPERVAHFLAWAEANPNWTGVRAANYVIPAASVETADCMATHTDGTQSVVNVCQDCHEISRTDCPHATPTLTLDYTDGRTVLVKVGEHTMTIRSGSDARLRAAFWARGLGYRPERGRALKWHRSGKTATARLSLV